jgi:hypothetical protein
MYSYDYRKKTKSDARKIEVNSSEKQSVPKKS